MTNYARRLPLSAAPVIALSAALVLALVPELAGIGQDATPKQNPFDQCAVCHSTDGSNGTGPTLKGVIGRQSGTVPGFRYSRAMRGAGITWDEKTLDRYLGNPQEVVAGNVMPFSGVPDPDERARIIAYLRSLK